jgi:membrane-associated protease RseP (regulator of RpoE activity)
MNVYHARALALLAVVAGAAYAADAPPTPVSPASPASPAAPASATTPPAPPSPSMDSNKTEQAHLERELQRAQEELNRAAREVAELSTRMREEAWSQIETNMDFGLQRSQLGINIGVVHGRGDESTDGVRILSVSPGGPAEKAGLKANDVIVSVGGTQLRGDRKTSAQEQLLAQMRRTQPGTPVAVEYRRDGNVQKVQVTPKGMQDVTAIRLSETLPAVLAPLKSMDRAIFWMDGAGFGSAELSDLSPGLGRYFGTDKGLLVVRAPKDDRLKLQDGDVILDIDGRVPGSPSHAYEILGSYHGGETLKLHVMRQQKKIELPIEIPEDTHAGMSRLRAEGFNRFDLISPRRLSQSGN